MHIELDRREQALVALGRRLAEIGYEFVTPTPATHRIINGRAASAQAASLRDVFGWSRPFAPALIPGDVTDICRDAAIFVPSGALLRSTVRWSSCAGRLFVHSAFPTEERDAVFFGPDSYRFVSLLLRTVWKARRLVDIGCGAGVGALALAHRADALVLADVNPRALRFAAVNARLSGAGMASVEVVESDVLAGVDGDVDVVIANPPYLVDEHQRTYRDGGGPLGTELPVRIVKEALPKLNRRGQLVLYSGSPVVDGRAVLCDQLQPILLASGGRWTWEELDPDVFGEELTRPAYAAVERIAVLGLVYESG